MTKVVWGIEPNLSFVTKQGTWSATCYVAWVKSEPVLAELYRRIPECQVDL